MTEGWVNSCTNWEYGVSLPPEKMANSNVMIENIFDISR